MQSTQAMETALVAHVAKGLIAPRTENNQYLKASYKGAGGLVPVTWNVKIYSSGAVVTTDEQTLMSMVNGSLKEPNSRLKLLQIDDAGWGFPLCGVMVGISNGKEIMTAVVDVRWFKKGTFESKAYLREYSKLARETMQEHFSSTPDLNRVEICSGYVNSVLKEDLRRAGYDVRTTVITGFLQEHLEKLYGEYVKVALGTDVYFDPKAFGDNKAALARKYKSVLEWGRRFKPEMLKDGWGSMQVPNR